MKLSRRGLLTAASAAPVWAARAGRAAERPTLRIGVLNDQSGPYRDLTGMTSVMCARQAVQDFGDHGFDVEIRFADHQNKPDIGAGIARQWIDNDGIDVIADVPTSSVALAVAQVCRQKDKLHLNTSATAVALTGEQCSPNTIVWSFDTYMMAVSSGGAMARGRRQLVLHHRRLRLRPLAGGADVADRQQRRRQHQGPRALPVSGYHRFLVVHRPGASERAKVLGLCNAGLDSVNCIKQAHEFGLSEAGMRVAPMLSFLTDIHAIGLPIAQGLTLTESFYWDRDARTRAFLERVRPKTPNNYPNQAQASTYAAVLHYLKTAQDMGAAEAKRSGASTVARMKAMPTDDDAFGPGSIRQDGRGVFPAYLFRVKTPAESTGPWDLYTLLATTPADQAARPLSETRCPMLKA